MATPILPEITEQRCYVRHDVIFNESDCGTATESPKQELEATVEPTTDVPLTLSSQKDPLTQEEEESELEKDQEGSETI